MNQIALELIKEKEDFRAKAYPDPLYGWEVPTIGYGTTTYPDGMPVKRGDVITQEQALEFLGIYIEDKILPELEKIPTWNQMNEKQQAALISFAYNIGEHFYNGKNFKSITKVCDSPELWSDCKWIEEQFVKYRNPGTKVEAGLRSRREAEAKLFCLGEN